LNRLNNAPEDPNSPVSPNINADLTLDMGYLRSLKLILPQFAKELEVTEDEVYITSDLPDIEYYYIHKNKKYKPRLKKEIGISDFPFIRVKHSKDVFMPHGYGIVVFETVPLRKEKPITF